MNPLVLVVWWTSGEQSISRPFVLSALVISEWETVDGYLERAGSSLERVRDALLVDVETQFVPWLLVVTRSHKLERSLDPEPLALACERSRSQWKTQYERCNSR